MSWSREKLEKFLPIADAVSQLSKDVNRKVGSLVLDPSYAIRSTGFNGFCKGADDSVLSRYVRPEKYFYTSHSESNSIAQAAATGTSTSGCAIVVSGLFPCAACARLIIQSGIVLVYAPKPDYTKERWAADFEAAENMFEECGIEVLTY